MHLKTHSFLCFFFWYINLKFYSLPILYGISYTSNFFRPFWSNVKWIFQFIWNVLSCAFSYINPHSCIKKSLAPAKSSILLFTKVHLEYACLHFLLYQSPFLCENNLWHCQNHLFYFSQNFFPRKISTNYFWLSNLMCFPGIGIWNDFQNYSQRKPHIFLAFD